MACFKKVVKVLPGIQNKFQVMNELARSYFFIKPFSPSPLCFHYRKGSTPWYKYIVITREAHLLGEA